ncbi:MAG: EAL domain-containing protein [Cellvibrionaceae bacterium]
MLKRFKPIRHKIMAIVIVSTCIAMALATITFTIQYTQTIHQDLETRVNIQSKALAQNIAASVVFGDIESGKEVLSAFAVDETVLAAMVRNDNALFVEYYSEGLNRQTDFNDKDIQFLTTPIIIDNEKIGDITVLISHSSLNARAYQIVAFSVITFFIAIAIASVVSYRLQRTISEPILELRDFADSVATKSDYKSRIKLVSDDEIGDLAEAFDHMLDQIEHRDNHLEKQVRQRTAELEKLADEFRHRAFHDSLTGLPNRALLNERFESIISHAKRTKTLIGTLLLDLDNFKTINDTLGHDFGDELLKLIAHRIQTVIRGEDIISRIGGDEFVVMVQDIETAEDLEVIAQNILAELRKDIVLFDQRIKSSVSIGGALYPADGTDLLTLKRNSDLAMYSAKESGKNQYRLFGKDMTDMSNQRLVVQNDLQSAIENGELEVFYQPKVDSTTGLASGCEALVRWHHPQEGFLSPDEFIPFAEENGLIKPLDHYVIRNVCQKIAKWKEQGLVSVPVAVNLSGLHFQNEEILEILDSSLSDSNISSDMLEIELTEAILIDDPDRALNILKKIRAMNIKVSLDDFGTGYSSLSYLRSLPIDIVKLDKSFIDRIAKNRKDLAITRGIVTLAKSLDLGVVAEGVESEEQLALLIEMGCEHVQGFYFSKPQPANIIQSWLQDNHRVLVD